LFIHVSILLLNGISCTLFLCGIALDNDTSFTAAEWCGALIPDPGNMEINFVKEQ
jgi:hypothetical protein